MTKTREERKWEHDINLILPLLNVDKILETRDFILTLPLMNNDESLESIDFYLTLPLILYEFEIPINVGITDDLAFSDLVEKRIQEQKILVGLPILNIDGTLTSADFNLSLTLSFDISLSPTDISLIPPSISYEFEITT
ncbi:MAG: hypothetical protein QXI09_03525 [Candidatus Aenigmatarchaeota archaeon]